MRKSWTKLWQNPVLMKEYQWRMRKKLTPWLLSFHLLLIGGLIFFVTAFFSLSDEIVFSTTFGTWLFFFFACLQLMLVAFILPAITAGLISSEREKQTLPLLLMTTLTSRQIIFGKWFAALSFMLLLYVSTFPIYMVIYNFGGLTMGNVLRVFLHLLVNMFFLSSVGIFFSTLIKRTGLATVLSYLVVMIWGVGTTVLIYVLFAISELLEEVYLIPQTDFPLLAQFAIILHPVFSLIFAFNSEVVSSISMGDITLPIYYLYLLIYSLVSVSLLWLSGHFLAPHRDRLGKGDRDDGLDQTSGKS